MSLGHVKIVSLLAQPSTSLVSLLDGCGQDPVISTTNADDDMVQVMDYDAWEHLQLAYVLVT